MRLQRPSPSLVISCIALFVALGGVGYAAATGSIDGREIKNNAVATKDLKNNDIRGRDIRRSTIAGSDVAFNTLSGADINETSLGKVPSAGTGRQRHDGGQRAASAGTVGGNGVQDVLTGHPEQHPHPHAPRLGARLHPARGVRCRRIAKADRGHGAEQHACALHRTRLSERPRRPSRVEDLDATDPPVAIDGNVADGIGTVIFGTSDGNSLTVDISIGDVDSFDEDVCGFVGLRDRLALRRTRRPASRARRAGRRARRRSRPPCAATPRRPCRTR